MTQAYLNVWFNHKMALESSGKAAAEHYIKATMFSFQHNVFFWNGVYLYSSSNAVYLSLNQPLEIVFPKDFKGPSQACWVNVEQPLVLIFLSVKDGKKLKNGKFKIL